jgi:hypothetical protein
VVLNDLLSGPEAGARFGTFLARGTHDGADTHSFFPRSSRLNTQLLPLIKLITSKHAAAVL